MSKYSEPIRWSAVKVAAAALALIALLAGVGAILIFVGRRLSGGTDIPFVTLAVAILACGAGWLLLEIAGSAVFEIVLLPFRSLYRWVVPEHVRERMEGTIGGPILLLLILGLLTVVLAAAWLANT